MTLLNQNYLKLPGSYLFSEIAKKVAAFKAAHPDKSVISLGIGDVSAPLAPAVVEALQKASLEMGSADTFRGYGPEQGYAFLREAILQNDYTARGIHLSADEIFVSDGAKSDVANFQELFSPSCVVAVQNPVYPVYVDTNVMAGRTGPCANGAFAGLVYLPCTQQNAFTPDLPHTRADLVYLCSPNNPTGAALTREQLTRWVNWAKANHAVILFDSAYEAFISQPDVPHSIYEIPGAQEVAVEFRSFSKTAGFTGTRCAYTVVPKALQLPEGVPSEPSEEGWEAYKAWIEENVKFNPKSEETAEEAKARIDKETEDKTKQWKGNAGRNQAILALLKLQKRIAPLNKKQASIIRLIACNYDTIEATLAEMSAGKGKKLNRKIPEGIPFKE